LWPNGWMDQDATWYIGRPRPRPHCIRWEPSSSPPERGTAAAQFSAHVFCGQTAGWIKMPRGIFLQRFPERQLQKKSNRSISLIQTTNWRVLVKMTQIKHSE